LGEVNMAVNTTWCNVAASCVHDLGFITPRKEHPQAGYFAIFDTDFNARGEYFTCCDLESISRVFLSRSSE
jgi:hypothetical protein